VLGERVDRSAGGPLCLVTAGIHGNEPAGVIALRRVFATIAKHSGRAGPLRRAHGQPRRPRASGALHRRGHEPHVVEGASRRCARRSARDNSEQREQRDSPRCIDRDLKSVTSA
jgi:hypothetical protein